MHCLQANTFLNANNIISSISHIAPVPYGIVCAGLDGFP